MPFFRKKPVVIEARLFDGRNGADIAAWSGGKVYSLWPEPPTLGIQTLEGRMTAEKGDWIIKGVAGEFYPCKPEIFQQTYELVAYELVD